MSAHVISDLRKFHRPIPVKPKQKPLFRLVCLAGATSNYTVEQYYDPGGWCPRYFDSSDQRALKELYRLKESCDGVIACAQCGWEAENPEFIDAGVVCGVCASAHKTAEETPKPINFRALTLWSIASWTISALITGAFYMLLHLCSGR